MNTSTRPLTALLVAVLLTTIGLTGCAGTAPTNIGITDNRLTPCPSSPNCVSSYAQDEGHAIAAIPRSGSIGNTTTELLSVLDNMGAVVITHQDRYIRAEFTSSLMRFVDDVEFYIEDSGIQVRSASRLGHSDFDANRKRIENIRKAML